MAVTVKRLGYTVSSISGGGGGSGTAERYSQSFNDTSSWTLSVDDYVITIPEATHEKGVNPTVTVYFNNTVTFEEAIVPITIDSSGEVKIYVSSSPDNRFAGKLIII